MSAAEAREWWTKTQHWPANGRTSAAEKYIAAVEAEVSYLAEVFRGVDTGDVWQKFSCSEINALTDVIRLVDAECAAFIEREHGEYDEPEDQHFISRGAAYYRDEPDGAPATQAEVTTPPEVYATEGYDPTDLGGAKR